MGTALAKHLERHLIERAPDLTREWVNLLSQRLDEHRRNVLPGDSILNHIPAVLQDLARYVGDRDRPTPLTRQTRVELGRLADLRRQQGLPLSEILTEFSILSRLVEDVIVEGMASFEGEADRVEIVRLVGRAKDAIFALGAETASRYRAWSRRHQEERLRLLEVYSAMLSHELGNRLGAAETAVRLLIAEPEIPPKRRERLHELVLQSIRNGLASINSVGVLFRDRDGAGSSPPMPIDVVVQETLHQLRVSAGAQGIRLELADDLPANLIDAERLSLVLYNLISNAVKHHDRHNGRGVVVTRVENGEDGKLTIVVADDGPGIATEFRDRIFEPHVRGATTKDGVGLGLAIAREAVEQMGGSIELLPHDGRGATFRFTLRAFHPPEDGKPAS